MLCVFQVEEKQRLKREEQERQRKEEQEEEARLQKDRDQLQERFQMEQDKQKKKIVGVVSRARGFRVPHEYHCVCCMYRAIKRHLDAMSQLVDMCQKILCIMYEHWSFDKQENKLGSLLLFVLGGRGASGSGP